MPVKPVRRIRGASFILAHDGIKSCLGATIKDVRGKQFTPD